MNILSVFIGTHLIKALESEFINYSPEIQALIIKEMELFVSEGAQWIASKLNKSDSSTGESV